ncbi:hypothetical protein B0H11DRAFT_57761 [Mycena galericulata]|nr:hypothetical protein B0H11DRAFT_57761 [Mycena galericulata]
MPGTTWIHADPRQSASRSRFPRHRQSSLPELRAKPSISRPEFSGNFRHRRGARTREARPASESCPGCRSTSTRRVRSVYQRVRSTEALKQKWDAARKNSKPYVSRAELTDLMTEVLVTHRKPFELKMGRREEDGGTGRQPAEQADAEQVAVAVPITPKLPPPFIRDNGESPPTPTISELDANLESIGYTPISFTLGDSSFATPAGERVIREVHVNGNIGVVITEDYDDADEALPEVPSDCTSDTTDEFIQIVTEATGIQPRWDLRDGTDSEMGQALFYWVDSRMGREDASRQWETAQVGESWERARQLIYGPLRTLLDFNRMAAESFHRRSSLLVGSPSSDTAPNISQSPTSLDFSLPSSAPVPYSSFPTCTNIDERNAGLGASNSGDKRKPSNSEPSSPEPPHKRFSAQLAEPEILGQLAGARRYILYGAQCVQDMLVRERADFRAATQRYLDENGWIYRLRPIPSPIHCHYSPWPRPSPRL